MFLNLIGQAASNSTDLKTPGDGGRPSGSTETESLLTENITGHVAVETNTDSVAAVSEAAESKTHSVAPGADQQPSPSSEAGDTTDGSVQLELGHKVVSQAVPDEAGDDDEGLIGEIFSSSSNDAEDSRRSSIGNSFDVDNSVSAYQEPPARPHSGVSVPGGASSGVSSFLVVALDRSGGQLYALRLLDEAEEVGPTPQDQQFSPFESGWCPMYILGRVPVCKITVLLLSFGSGPVKPEVDSPPQPSLQAEVSNEHLKN